MPKKPSSPFSDQQRPTGVAEAVCQAIRCKICGKPATCIGIHDDHPEGAPPAPACDDCCGHGLEDGWCEPIENWNSLSEEAKEGFGLTVSCDQSTEE